MAAAKNYLVECRDVDGRSVRYYAKRHAALARFVEMAGHSVESAIAEQYHSAASVPSIDEVLRLRAVGNFGNVVAYEVIGEAAMAEVVAARKRDWCLVGVHPVYDNRDGICGSRRMILAGPFAEQSEASAAVSSDPDEYGDMEVYVARRSEGLRRPAPPAVPLEQQYAEDIPF